MLVVPDAVSRSILNTLIGVGGQLHGAKVDLYQNNYVPTHSSVLGDYTVCNFTGYAQSSAITWGTVFTDPNYYAHTVGDVKQFTAGALSAPQLAYGYFVTDSGGGYLYGERFDSPVAFNVNGDSAVVIPQFTVISQQT